MNNIISILDFTNPYLVYAPGGTEHETYLNELITIHQEDILKQILGIQTYNTMNANMTEDVWVEFIGGKEYPVDGIDYKYNGIKGVLARMVYYHWHDSKKQT